MLTAVVEERYQDAGNSFFFLFIFSLYLTRVFTLGGILFLYA